MSVQSIERAFYLLRTIADAQSGIGVSELALRTELHKSTVSRLVAALESESAVSRTPSGELIIGNGVNHLLAERSYDEQLITLLTPCLETLSSIVKESVGLSVPDGKFSRPLLQLPSAHVLRISDWTGVRFPPHVTSPGKLYMAHWTKEKQDNYMERPLSSFTPATITDPDALRQRLAQIKADGFDWTEDEYEVGLVTVSAPVLDETGEFVASIFISAPSFRFPLEGGKQSVTNLLLDSCRLASEKLGEMG